MNLTLQPFQPGLAATVASWVQDPRELFQLAPRTPWPLTPEKIRAWADRRNAVKLLTVGNPGPPAGYAEINRTPSDPQNYWLGHIVLDPRLRNRGIGTRFVTLLLGEIFDSLGGDSVSLVVLPDNTAACRCYLNAGFLHTRDEYHRYPTDRRLRMRRLDVTREQWLARTQSARNRTAQLAPS